MKITTQTIEKILSAPSAFEGLTIRDVFTEGAPMADIVCMVLKAQPETWFPLLSTPFAIRWEMLSEQQAVYNHSQTLKRLAERGGLDPTEAKAVCGGSAWRTCTQKEAFAALIAAVPPAPPTNAHPIDMILFCPRCGVQHVDASEAPSDREWAAQSAGDQEQRNIWTNPPHKSHMCHACGCIWRPADVPTNGVSSITTNGQADNFDLTKPLTLPKNEYWLAEDDMRNEWRCHGGQIHGPLSETVTMPERLYFLFRRHLRRRSSP